MRSKKEILTDIILLVNVIGVIVLFLFFLRHSPESSGVSSQSSSSYSKFSLSSNSNLREKVELYDTKGSVNENDWVKIENKDYAINAPQDLIIQNEYIRISYEKHRSRLEQAGSHVWSMRNSCGKFTRLTNPSYGDYTYYVDTVDTPPTEIKIVSVSPTRAIVDFYYKDHTVKNREGLPKEVSAGSRPFIKRIDIDSDMYGAYLSFRSNDPNPPGEKEFSLGMGTRIYYGATDNWLWDFLTNTSSDSSKINKNELPTGAKLMPHSNYYLGFPDKAQFQEYYYLILAMPEDYKASMYKFSGIWGGPIINNYIENDKYRGVFLGAVPYQGQFVQEAEFLDQDQAEVINELSSARNNSALKLREKGRVDIFPPNIFSSGSYKIAIRGLGQKAQLEVHSGEKTFNYDANNLSSDIFQEFFLDKEINYNPNLNENYYIVLRNGQLTIDNIYYIPIKSDHVAFPENVIEKINFKTN